MLDVERCYLEGACDMHIHTGPDTYYGIHATELTSRRLLDSIEAAQHAKDAGMRAILVKCVDICTIDRAYCARKVVPGIEVFGELNMSYTVGGFNAAAIQRSVKFGPGPNLLRMVMVTSDEADPPQQLSTTQNRRLRALGKPGLTAFKNGKPIPGFRECLEEIASNDLILGCYARPRIVGAARDAGVEKIAIQHPEYMHVPGEFALERQLADMGAYLELYTNACLPPGPRITFREYAEIIRNVGAEHCVVTSDMGQIYNPSPVQGLRMFIVNLLQLGISQAEIDIMVKQNPASLLGLE